MRSRTLFRAFIALVVIAIAIQFIPVERANPPVEQEPEMSDAVRAVLVRSCYDCHSNETTWPWYSRVAPVSWLIAHDVNDGRAKLNFSRWNAMKPERQAHKLDETREVLEKGEMPPAIYMPMHPEARLTDAEKELLIAWAAALEASITP